MSNSNFVVTRATTNPSGIVSLGSIVSPAPFFDLTGNLNMNGLNLIGTATAATNVTITDDNTNATLYPVFVSNNTGNLPLKVDKTTNPLSYNPSTGTMVAQSFSPGSGFSTFSALTTAGLEVLNATSGRTKVLNNQITCATTATNPPTTTINPDSITCSSLNAASTTTITPTSVTAGSGTSVFSAIQNTGLQVVNAGSNSTTVNSFQMTCSQVSPASTTTITPTSVTATTFNGALSGNATTATNIAGGTAGRIPYQTGAGATAFIAVGNGGQFLQANGPAAPTWVTQNGTATVTLLSNTTGTTNFPSSGTATLTVNFNSAYSSVTRFPVTISNSNGSITIGVNTYTLSGGLAGGQYTIALEVTMAGNAGTTLNFNGTGIATGARYNFTSISNTYGGTTVTKYIVLTFAYDGTNYYLSGSNFS